MKIAANAKCDACGEVHPVLIELPEEKLSKLTEVKEVTKMPRWQPREYCKYGECGEEHKNPGYSMKVTKRCANDKCGQFAPGPASKCAWCGSKEDGEPLPKEDRWIDLDDDELRQIPDPREHGHEY